MNTRYDVVIIGGGIVGLAHAWMATERGLRVHLLERSSSAQGASVRNFGMVWPIGQPAGELHDIALAARERWLELHHAGVITVEPCGSIHAAHHDDEWAVLQEFCNIGDYDVQMLSANEVIKRAPIVNPEGLRGGMFSNSELRVNPRVASAQIAKWLQSQKHVTCDFDTTVTKVDDHVVHASDGRKWSAGRIIICSGSDLQTLFPEVLQNSGLRLCKLQMLKATQPHSMPAMPHIASGLTLRHYHSFAGCPALAALKKRIATDAPELDKYGIHVMASTFANGDVLLGDSHEYGADISPFDKAEIDQWMLRELRKVIRLDDWTIRERWHGIYAKHPDLPVVSQEPMPQVNVFVGTGGAGMTMSFGLADRAWKCWMGETANV